MTATCNGVLPKKIDKVNVPPIKIQGIKTKLVPWIAENIHWEGAGTYFEPFIGSGVVGFNLAPQRAIFADVNPHLINFYKRIQFGEITEDITRKHLTAEGRKLENTPLDSGSYYYEVRERFNKDHNPLDLLFLSRTNFNGLMRFNKNGRYNASFGKNQYKLSKSLINDVSAMVGWLEKLFAEHPEWEFRIQSFEELIPESGEGDFIYLDPPYIGLNDTYFSSWGMDKAEELAVLTQQSDAGWALSMWLSNEKGRNDYLDLWDGVTLEKEHSYRIASSAAARTPVVEALVISKGSVNME